MKIIPRVLRLEQTEYYKKHLSIINCLLPTNLTNKEIEVLSSFLSLDKVLIEEDMFNTQARKKVMTKLNLKPGGLGNHLKSMIDKKVLERNEYSNKLSIRDFLLPEEDEQGYQIKIIKDEAGE